MITYIAHATSRIYALVFSFLTHYFGSSSCILYYFVSGLDKSYMVRVLLRHKILRRQHYLVLMLAKSKILDKIVKVHTNKLGYHINKRKHKRFKERSSMKIFS